MRIVFIGAGNLATRLAIELHKKSYQIIQVYNRTLQPATILAEHINSYPIDKTEDIRNDADLYIFSVKDDALSGLLKQIPANNGIWVHTAGSVPMNIFKGYSANYGVIYPFQTFSKTREVDFSNIPVFIEANTEKNLRILESVFLAISGKVIELPSEKRKYVHLTGVFACNFVNHMYAISQKILEKNGIPFNIVLPLIEETAAKVHQLEPADAQTGPAVRFDETIINKHLSLLDNFTEKEIYKSVSMSIHEFAKNKKT